jgi:flagellar motility protein MotE (MotC chaperone)
MADNIFDDEVEKASEEVSQGQDTQAPENVSPEVAAQLGQIEDLVAMDPSFADTQEYKDLMAQIEEQPSGQAAEEEEEEGKEPETNPNAKPADAAEEEDEEEEEEDVDNPDDVFGVLDNKPKKKVKVDFEIPEEMEAMLTEKYGIEDPSTFFTSVDTWRSQAQEGATAQKKYDAIAADIQNLPPDLRNSISLWADGEDYTSPFVNGERLSFEADFKDQDVDSLVQHYLPDEYNDLIDSFENDEITEEVLDDKLALLARTTRKMFTDEKKALETERAQYTEKQQNAHKLLKESALGSVEALSKSYPNFRKAELNKVRNILVEGKVDDFLYNPDGTYTEEAAELVANMLFGGKMREQLVKRAKRQGESEANQKIVDSSPKKLKKQKSANQKGGLNPKAVEHLTPVFERNPYE